MTQFAPSEILPAGQNNTNEACRWVVESMSHGAMLVDAAGTVTLCNLSAERILGIARDSLIGSSPLSDGVERWRQDEAVLAPDEHPAIVTLRTGVGLHYSVFGSRRTDGRKVWVSMNTRLVSGEAGKTIGVVCTFSDFTIRRGEIAEFERLSLVAKRTDDSVIVTDASGNIEWCNDAFLSLTGHELGEVLGRKPGEILQGPETDPDAVIRMRAAAFAGERWSGEVINYRKDGTPFWHEFAISPARNGAGEVTHYVSIGRDITAKKTLARRFLQLSAVVEASVDGIAVIDAFQEVKFANGAFARIHGFDSGAELQGKSWRGFYPKDQLTIFDKVILPRLYVEDYWQGELVGQTKSQAHFPQELTASLLSGGMVMVVRDISDRKRAQAEQARMTAILEATPDLIAISSTDGDVLYLNHAGQRMIGREFDGRMSLDELFSDDARRVLHEQAIPFAVEYGVWSGEVAIRGAQGQEVPVSQVIIAHKGDDGAIEYLSTIMRDITERKESEEALRKMSLSDQLTGAYNRRGFMLLAQQQLNVARQQPGHTILLYFDLNDFKPVNDTYGHQAGDQALQEVAEVLRDTFRDSDVIGRLGGDEFVVLAVNCLDASGEVLMSRLDQKLQARNSRPGRQFQISLGRGMARFDPEDPKNLQQLLDEADTRLYENKRRTKAERAGAA